MMVKISELFVFVYDLGSNIWGLGFKQSLTGYNNDGTLCRAAGVVNDGILEIDR